jgi:hypothetical protein
MDEVWVEDKGCVFLFEKQLLCVVKAKSSRASFHLHYSLGSKNLSSPFTGAALGHRHCIP